MQVRKVCLLGDFGVGKTSLVQRFVTRQFSEKYLTTIGVKIDTKELQLDSVGVVKLIVWDIAGTETLGGLFGRYLQGVNGYLLVADGTRAHTLENAIGLKRQVEGKLGTVPFVGLVNKVDLEGDWELATEGIERLTGGDPRWSKCSAKSGENVERAFRDLARQMVG